MFATVICASLQGVDASLVRVEADVSTGLPSFNMVGFLSTQVKEAQDRVRTALKNTGYPMEPKRVTVNLSPADEKKSGTCFDLPIALAIAAAYGKIPQERLQGIMVAGELSLNGEVLPVPGILPMAVGAKKQGLTAFLLPRANQREGAMVPGISVIGVSTLQEALSFLAGEIHLEPADPTDISGMADTGGGEDFADLCGQEVARRAAEVAVCGFHNLLMVGPPGAGKSSLAKRIPSILPELTMEECLEISKIYSISGLLSGDDFFIWKRPFRAPHHTITPTALAGGGNYPRPGEISLAHNGILFLDELPEFSREALEILRQPLEEHTVSIARSRWHFEFPADFMLVAAMNPCPCGHFPSDACRCTPWEVKRYLNRLSAPLLERIDITVEVPALQYQAVEGQKNESSAKIRERVRQARKLQAARYAKEECRFNSQLTQSGIRKYCALGKHESDLMKEAYEKLDLSVRTYFRVLKVARTIADLEGSEQIREEHLGEALCYRSLNRKYWKR